jgi:predicted CoA-binding protein
VTDGVWHNDPTVMADLLRGPGTWAVVGLRNNPARAAYGVAAYLQQRLGKRLVPIHPRAEPVHGERAYPSLADVPTEATVDVVDVFVRSALAGGIVDDAIAHRDRLGISAVWLQLGVVDAAAAARAVDAGLQIVMDACPKIEAPRLGVLTA